MSTEAPTREEFEQLRERLAVAETVCTIFGWTGSGGDSERDKAVLQAWMHWSNTYGSPDPSPEWDERVRELAAKRDEIRTRTLAAIRERYFEPVPDSSASQLMPDAVEGCSCLTEATPLDAEGSTYEYRRIPSADCPVHDAEVASQPMPVGEETAE